MNKKQQGVLIGAAVIILAMLIYPPFHIIAQNAVINAGYAFFMELRVHKYSKYGDASCSMGGCITCCRIAMVGA